MSAILLYGRLAAACAILLAPGFLLARALGLRTISAGVSLALAVIFAASVVTFAAHASLDLTLALVLAAGIGALPFAIRGRRHREAGRKRAPLAPADHGRYIALAAGLIVGLLFWQIAGHVSGDAIFHLARVRKLDDLDALSLGAVGEFLDGSLHPGYAFPLWHVFLALISRVAFVDPADVLVHAPSVLAPLVVAVSYEAGYALFRRVGAALAVAAAIMAQSVFAPGSGGVYASLALPATSSQQLLVPAALTLALLVVREPTKSGVAATALAALGVAVVHGSYAVFLCIPFAGFLVVRFLWTRLDLRAGAVALAALAVPPLLFFAWLLPTIRDTASVSPDATERTRALRQYASQLDVSSPTSFHLSPEALTRSGAVAVAALFMVGLAAFAPRRRWAAYVVGGALSVMALVLISWLFVPFSDLVSLSQARRVAAFLPFAFAFAGGMAVLSSLLGKLALPLSFACGVILQVIYSGDFEYALTTGGPAVATWVGLGGGIVALVLGVRRTATREGHGLAAALLFLLPVVVHGLANWTTTEERRIQPLTPGLIAAVRSEVPVGAVVYSDLEASYRIGAFAPVYVCNGPPAHVADTEKNRPYERRDERLRFQRTGDLDIPRACGATFLVVDRSRFDVPGGLGEPIFRDARFSLFAVPLSAARTEAPVPSPA